MKKTAKWIVTALAASLALLVMGCENEPDPVAVESVTVSPSTLMLGVGDTVLLSATVSPWSALGWTLTWESSNDDVVTVGEYGKVAAMSVGTATITAKASGKQGTCEVTVHVHSYSEGKCTVCEAKLKIEGYAIGNGGVLWGYSGKDATVTIPETVTGIGYGAFYDNNDIESVTIPSSVKSIESRGSGYSDHGAFEGCTNLKTVTMCEGVESIGDYAFYNCKSLTSVTIPTSVTSIGDGAFWNCTNLTEIQFEGTKEQWNAIEGSDNLGILGIRCSDGHIGVVGVPAYLTVSGTEVTGYNYGYGKLPANIVIPEGITGIKQGAFYDNKDIESVTIAGSVKSIESRGSGYSDHGAFEGCTNLKTVTMGEGVESIGDYAFYKCQSLASVTIPASVTSIGGHAFDGCSSLESVTYKGTLAQWCAMSNVYYFMSNAKTVTLGGMPNLKAVTKLTIPEGVESIGDFAFYYCTNLTEVEIPNTVKSIGYSAFYGCKSLATVKIPASVTSIGMSAFSGCSSLASVTIPASVTSIGWYAFSGCESLTEIEIPGSVTSIEDSAFSGCSSLATVTINDGVESVGSGAFSGCESLTEIEIPGSVTSIEDRAFSGCTSLTSVTIDEGVTSIGGGVFARCERLTKIEIPGSVKSIGDRAFDWCYNATVKYGGTEEQWNAITKDSYYGLSGMTITGKDGTTWKAE